MSTPHRRANAGPPDGYRNRAMTRDEALAIAMEAGALMSDRDAKGGPIARTTHAEITPRGDGYDLRIPAEHLSRLSGRGRDAILDAILCPDAKGW